MLSLRLTLVLVLAAVAQAPPKQERAVVGGKHAYFERLQAHPGCLTAFDFRSQANIDILPSRATSAAKIPIVYDPTEDAARFEIDPSGSLPNSGSTGTPQKRVPLNVHGATSLLVSWDLKIADSMRRRGPRYLDQHKSHRLDDPSASAWLGFKQNYARAANRGRGIAQYFFTTGRRFMGPGTRQGGSETILPVLAEFYVQPDRWTRVWVFLAGNIGIADKVVQMSIWLADEDRDPIQLYDRVNMVTPAGGIGLFRFEFDSSLKKAANGPGQQWQRNFVALSGLTVGEVVALLERP